jgi:hypothetical protein
MDSDDWHYSDPQGSYGPFTLDALKLALHVRPHYYDVLVWRAGLPERRKATDVPELELLDVVDGRVVTRGQDTRRIPGITWIRALPVIVLFVAGWLSPSAFWGPLFWATAASLAAVLYFRVPPHLLPVLGVGLVQWTLGITGVLLFWKYLGKDNVSPEWYLTVAVLGVFACLILWVFIAKSRASLIALFILQLFDICIVVVIPSLNSQPPSLFVAGLRLLVLGGAIYALVKYPKSAAASA